MKKIIRNFIALAFASAMTLTIGMTVYADDTPTRDTESNFTKSGDTANTGINEFYLIKDYDSINPTVDSPNSNSPAETFTYTIKPYAVWNAGSTYDDNGTATKIDTSNMPMPTWNTSIATGIGANRTLTVTQSVDIGQAHYEETSNDTTNKTDEKQTIKLPTYDTVGDYWYKVEETIGNTTGVIYGTNSNTSAINTALSNGGYDGTYYIHVQVTEKSTTTGTSELVRNVTMHQSAPDPDTIDTNKKYNDSVDTYYTASNKVNAIENQYYAGELVIKKEVTGNAGDKDEYFPVTVVFTKPQGTIINSDITFNAVLKEGNTYTSTDCVIKGNYYTGNPNKSTFKWSASDENEATATCTFYVKDNTTVTFSNIPYGINYTISEELSDTDTYQNEIKFTSNSKDIANPTFDGQALTSDTDSVAMSSNDSKTAQGSISDEKDEVTITNQKDTTIDIGVLLSNKPFITMIGGVGIVMTVFLNRRKKTFED